MNNNQLSEGLLGFFGKQNDSNKVPFAQITLNISQSSKLIDVPYPE